MIYIKENNDFGIQSNLNDFAKNFYGASNAARLYASAFKTIPKDYGLGMSKALRDQVNAYKSIAPTSKYFEQTLEAMKLIEPTNIALGQISTKSLRPAMSSSIAKQISKTTRQLHYNIPIAQVNQARGLSEELHQAMKLLLDSNDLKLKATVNTIFNELTANPINAYQSFQKAIQAPVTPTFNHPDYNVREETQTVENNNQESNSNTETDDSFNTAKSIIKKYTNSIKENYAKSYDPERVINFFINLMQFVTFLSFFVGLNSDTKTGIEMSEALCGCIKWAISYDKSHRPS